MVGCFTCLTSTSSDDVISTHNDTPGLRLVTFHTSHTLFPNTDILVGADPSHGNTFRIGTKGQNPSRITRWWDTDSELKLKDDINKEKQQ